MIWTLEQRVDGTRCDRHEINELPIYWRRRKLSNNFKASHQLSYESLEDDVKAPLARFPSQIRSRGCSSFCSREEFSYFFKCKIKRLLKFSRDFGTKIYKILFVYWKSMSSLQKQHIFLGRTIKGLRKNRFESFDCGRSLALGAGVGLKFFGSSKYFCLVIRSEHRLSLRQLATRGAHLNFLLFLVSVNEGNVGAQRLRETFFLLLHSLLASVAPKYGRCSISWPIFICSHLKPRDYCLGCVPSMFCQQPHIRLQILINNKLCLIELEFKGQR